jgi:hypothetical protein
LSGDKQLIQLFHEAEVYHELALVKSSGLIWEYDLSRLNFEEAANLNGGQSKSLHSIRELFKCLITFVNEVDAIEYLRNQERTRLLHSILESRFDVKSIFPFCSKSPLELQTIPALCGRSSSVSTGLSSGRI